VALAMIAVPRLAQATGRFRTPVLRDFIEELVAAKVRRGIVTSGKQSI
jgi:hypothetical protein